MTTFRNRIMPCLLLDGNKLVKTVKFKNPKYIGNPINAVKIFNDIFVDEIILLNIYATKRKESPPFDLLKEIFEESLIPVSYGGGINNISDAKKLIRSGCEKISIGSYFHKNPKIVRDLSEEIGSQSVVVSVDIYKNIFGNYHVYIDNGKKRVKTNYLEYLQYIEFMKAGEILLQSINNDGKMEGFDLKLIENVCNAIRIPVTVFGGARNLDDCLMAVKIGGASGAGMGSRAVYSKNSNSVLINFPSKNEIREKFRNWKKNGS